MRRKLKTASGIRVFYASTEGGLKYLKLNIDKIDPMLYYTVPNHIDDQDIVWDVGGNVGYFTLLASAKAVKGECLCIEPDTWLCNVLHKTKWCNADLKINVLPIAVSNAIGISKFNIASRARAANFLDVSSGSTQTVGIREVRHVPTFTLDSLLEYYTGPTFLKIDTEGAEQMVVEGAKEVLSGKPKILIEVYQISFMSIKNELLRNGYTLYDASKLPEMVLLRDDYSENIFTECGN